MASRDAFARQLLELYRSDVREFLAEHKAANLDALDQNAELLEKAITQTGELKIGFVGEAQVGKSTLINALLDRQALPEGGIGPLTAQATRVTYATENGLLVTYHGKGQLHRHAFAVARYLERRGELKSGSAGQLAEQPAEFAGATDASTPDSGDITEDSLVLALTEPTVREAGEGPSDGDAPSAKSELGEYMLSQAKRILHFANPAAEGDTPSNVTLLDGLRAVIGQRPLGDPAALAPYQERIEEVRRVLGQTEELTETSLGSVQQFNRALRVRAAGWMSPLVSELRLRLKSAVLEGLTLVDLPGIGVLGDPAGHEAEKFVRMEGDALIIVFQTKGLPESIAEMLERTGVITKLLFGGRDGVPPVHLTVVATHLDDVARTRYRILAQEARENGEAAPDRHALFRGLSAEMAAKLREQIGDALRRSKAFEDLPEDQRQAREAVVSRLCGDMAVVCAVAPDYLSMSLGVEDGSAFLRDPEATGVPELRRHLASLTRDAANRRARAILQFERALRQAIRDHLAAIAQMYEEGRGAAMQEWERFRDGLTRAAEPLRQEMLAYHGESLGVLRKGLQTEIELLCKEAELAGNKKLQRLTREGRTMPYMSLKAALVRDGRWDRRGIDYPEALTLAMVDSIATQWEPKVVEKVRDEVRALADRDLKLVERLCEEARRIDERIVAEAQLDVQKKILQSNSRTAVAWTKEQLEELRTSVFQTLRSAVAPPFERACKKAVRADAHRGSGAKHRILEVFEDGGDAAVEEARKAAETMLKSHYNGLLRKLNEGFLKENHDPVQAALDALTGEEIARARRSDAQRKRVVLTNANAFDVKLKAIEAGLETLPEVAPWRSVPA